MDSGHLTGSHCIVLASRSPARRSLLRAAGYRLTVHAADIDEEALGIGLSFGRRLSLLAQTKALAVADRFPDAYVIGADTALWLDGQWLGKAADAATAGRLLEQLAGRRHRVGSAVCVVAPRLTVARPRRLRRGVDTAWVTLRPWAAERIKRYVQRVQPYECAGAYALQDRSRSAPIARVEGDPSTVIGLPLTIVDRLLAELGYAV